MNWLSRLLSPSNPPRPAVSREFTADGVLIRLAEGNAANAGAGQALAFVTQLAGAEQLEETDDGLLWRWSLVYAALRQDAGELALLDIPAVVALRPTLQSHGSLVDLDFGVRLCRWEAPDGREIDDFSRAGGVAWADGEACLLPEPTYRLLERLTEFVAVRERDANYNRRCWGELRALAIEAGARLDQFLLGTVVLTPEKLRLEFDRADSGGVDVITVEPWFEGAPKTWLKTFDSFDTVRDLYELPTADGVVQVIVTPEVKTVLRSIKRMHGRRIAGRAAERFLQNPLAALGEAAGQVLDAQQVEQAREEAGIEFQRFTARLRTTPEGVVEEVALLIESAGSEAMRSATERFRDARDLGQFVNGVKTRLATGDELYRWRGYDLQLLGDTALELETLELAYAQWTRPQVTIRYADVADLKRYSERVAGIGVQKPLVSPYLPKRSDSTWWPEDVAAEPPPVIVTLETVGGETDDLPVTKAVVEAVEKMLGDARAKAREAIDWPEIGKPVSVATCEEVLAQVREAWAERPAAGGKPPGGKRPPPTRERKELLLRANVESEEYRELRGGALRFDPSAAPKLPRSLRAEAKLLPHQKVGIAWMQNLLAQAPRFCRGAVLADDMGLGKTLQLLTVIAQQLESIPNLDPILVVAPVSLLENWKQEAQRFFVPGTFRMLTLYDSQLSALRETPARIEEQLRTEGIAKFLKPGWVGDHNVVLTTYETLRDLEFSFAPLRWSLMICDEAQKIKNPAAMMTRSAKKQQVAFKIACTGTPVENTLVDLWCLFDYVQPGLLGSLNRFGETYRRPIECETDDERAKVEELRALIEPQILRRTKQQVADGLPEKVIDQSALNLSMSGFQRKLYAEALEQFKNRRDRSRPTPFRDHLTLLQYLRRICTDPREYGKQFVQPEPLNDYRTKSPKLDWLLKTLEQVRAKREKAIVFCEFRDMQRMLAHYIREVFGFAPDIINGDTSACAEHAASRHKRISAFQAASGFGVIILSPLAVGFGVNIQKANHVIHFTRTWNPAKEDQATDRAYRIGQDRDVYVYYPVVRAEFPTFDAKLHELLEAKRSLSADMLNGTGEARPAEFDDVVAVGGDVFDERISIDDAVNLDPLHFEALVAVLWKKRFRTVTLTPGSGDDGVDVVAKSQKVGELVQCKTSMTPGAALDWNAVKDVVTGKAAYARRYPGTDFGLVCVTNQFFNENAQRMAEYNGVRLFDQAALKRLLDEHRVTMLNVYRFLEVRPDALRA